MIRTIHPKPLVWLHYTLSIYKSKSGTRDRQMIGCGGKAGRHSFYHISKVLLTDRRYKSVSIQAKVPYGLIPNRIGLSVHSVWVEMRSG